MEDYFYCGQFILSAQYPVQSSIPNAFRELTDTYTHTQACGVTPTHKHTHKITQVSVCVCVYLHACIFI